MKQAAGRQIPRGDEHIDRRGMRILGLGCDLLMGLGQAIAGDDRSTEAEDHGQNGENKG